MQSNPKTQKSSNQTKKQRVSKRNYNENYNGNIVFDDKLIEQIFFIKIKPDRIKDIVQYVNGTRQRKSIINKIKLFFNKQKSLQDGARLSHYILEDLVILNNQPKIPGLIIRSFIEALIMNKKKIQKILDKKAGDKLLDNIPTDYLISIIQLYDLKITKKQTLSFIQQFERKKYYQDIFKLIKLTKNQINYDYSPLIQSLIKDKNYKQIRKIPEYKKCFQKDNNLKKIQNDMMIRGANYHFKQGGWQYLQQIYQYHPEVISYVINKDTPKLMEKNLQGIVSICQRIPNLINRIKPNVRQKIIKKKQLMKMQNKPFLQNSMKVDQFAPSSKQYFSFQEFGYNKDQIIIINNKIDNKILIQTKQKILSSQFIGIDTQSTIARTPIDSDIDILALIQLSTEKDIFIFDVFNSNNSQIKNIFQQFFKNKNKKVIGHTIKGDIYAIANFFKLQNPQCQMIDVCQQFKKLKRPSNCGLKHISKQILGKQICKKYTMTNWERRPLTLSQIHYAAMDAFILIKIWEKLQKLVQEKIISRKQSQHHKSEKNKQAQIKQPNQIIQKDQNQQAQINEEGQQDIRIKQQQQVFNKQNNQKEDDW